jgi:hypothetical protein
MIDYCYRLANAFICQVIIDSIVGSIPPSIYDFTPCNLYYAVAVISCEEEEQDWW